MKILHVCLGERYVDGYGYQENVLTKIHKQQGHEVFILASTLSLVNQKPGFVEPAEYINEYGIPIKRIPYVSWQPKQVASKLRLYKGTYASIAIVKPDIIFVHGASFMDVRYVARYAKETGVKVFVDNHGDYINSGKNWFSKNILHKIVYRWCYKQIIPFTTKFYGTLPIRNNYLIEVYKVPSNMVELLPMGIDLSEGYGVDRVVARAEMRQKYGFSEEDFVVITGGKLEKRKNTVELIKAIISISNPHIKLFLFGSVSDNIKEEAEKLINDNKSKISYGGWAKWNEINKYLLVGDLCIFPGTHSSIWEQAVGMGLPCVFKHWDNITHVDLEGNCLLLDDVSTETIASTIVSLFEDKERLSKMKMIAAEKGPKTFSYEEIAKRAINDN